MVPRTLGMVTTGLLFLAGCAGSPAPGERWAKAGASAQSFAADHLACRTQSRNAQTRQAPFASMAQANPLEADRIYATCMATKGYRPDPAGFTPPEQSGIVTR